MPRKSAPPSRFSLYYRLAKPGIVYGNAITAIAGFFFALRGTTSLRLFVAMLVGICLVMASGCVYNNYLDRDIDKMMKRTQRRASVTGDISLTSGMIYATILGVIGTGTLWYGTNPLTAWIGLFGLVVYVLVYGWAKRTTVHGTLIGAIAGAVPPVAGYTAITNRLDGGALILFLILVAWQMPHFFAIAIYREDDYAAAKLPVLPLVSGLGATKVQIVSYMVAFSVTALVPTIFGYTGYIYLIIAVALSIWWLGTALRGFRTPDTKLWARQVFKQSIVVLTALSVALAIGPHLI